MISNTWSKIINYNSLFINIFRPIITPLVLPLFDETNFSKKIYQEKVNPDAGPKQKADLPEQGPGSRYARNPSVTQHIMNVVHKTM